MFFPTAKRALLASALLLPAFVVFVAAAGCSSSVAQPSARDQATTATCDLAEKCDTIGEGKQYTSRDDCETTVGGLFNEAWPAEICTNIQGDPLNSCTKAIENTTCENVADLVNTFANKCSRGTVCGTDGGS